MAKYRKIPVVIDAWQNDSDAPMPDWLCEACDDGSVRINDSCLVTSIRTLEGFMHPADRDWIIRGVAGEIYSCKPDIFSATYEAVTDPGVAEAEEEKPVFDTTYSDPDTHSS